MDVLISAFIFLIVGVFGLIALRVKPKKPESEGSVKCPRCSTESKLKDVACSNCRSKELKIIKTDPAKKLIECPKCKMEVTKLICPKCDTDLIKLLLDKNP